MKRISAATWMILSLTAFSSNVHAAPYYQHCADFIARFDELICDKPICPHWYVGGNIGVSHLFDRQTTGLLIGSSVDENGPGWSVDFGYQFTQIFGAELGYVQYHDSRENSGNFNVGKTEHYAVYLAATVQFPIYCHISILGKLGAAYSYANRILNGIGNAYASGSGSPYAAAGLLFKMSSKVDFIGQWSRAWGNHLTGSADLYSIGVQYNIY